MRHYETTYILRPNLGEEQFTEIIERTNALITNNGGTIIDLNRWGMKKLAYEIKKEVQGYYVYTNYAAPGEIISEMERIFRIDDRLLRFLTIKISDSIDEAAINEERERLAQEAAALEAEEAGEAEEEENTEKESKEAADSTEKKPAAEASEESNKAE